MFTNTKSVDSRQQFLAQAKAKRLVTEERDRTNAAAVKIQALMRSYITRKSLTKSIRHDFDTVFCEIKDSDKGELADTSLVWNVARPLVFIFDPKNDLQRLQYLCRYLVASMDSPNPKTCVINLALRNNNLLVWVRFMKKLLSYCASQLPLLSTDLSSDSLSATLYLHTLVSFTCCKTWTILKSKKGDTLKPTLDKVCTNIIQHLVSNNLYSHLSILLVRGLCRSKPSLKPVVLSATVRLSLRALTTSDYSEPILCEFIGHILSIPSFLLRVSKIDPQCVTLIVGEDMFGKCVGVLSEQKTTQMIFCLMGDSDALGLLANLVHMAHICQQQLVEHLLEFALIFENVITRVVERCSSLVSTSKKQLNHWHPVLGWFSKPLPQNTAVCLPEVVEQLGGLWSESTIRCLFKDLPEELHTAGQTPSPSSAHATMTASVKNLWKKVQERQANSCKTLKRLGTTEVTLVSLVCSLYQNMLCTFTQLRYDILSGLCYQDFLLPRLWSFMTTIGPQNGLKAFMELLIHNPKATAPEFQIVVLFADCATYLITILDDFELYEQHKPFTFEQLRAIAHFSNQFLFKSVWEGCIDARSASFCPVWKSVHGLLMLLYQRDCRRQFTNSQDFWLIKDVKPASFINDYYEKKNKKAELLIHKMPHIVPHKDRVLLFRRYVSNDRERLGLNRDVDSLSPSTLISVHRPRIVEDGYRQLSLLPVESLKGVIRVKFINQQGLDEAGIDQDGVFKEFLEETITRVFDPALNLFKSTETGSLFPSSTSNIHENHLALFDFVGRMLGKAVYEGIICEVPFATFFLSHVLGKNSGSGYSAFDELPSLDPELYKNLTYIKHYDGDIGDLELTFAYNEEHMGEMMTHDLVPGGRTISVTNENKISYIHHMAHFRMHTQIKDQISAFIRGFRAIINPEWLSLFSPQEANKLISGDCEDVDLADLRRHTQYYGGFHNGHKVITWLWDILNNDFTFKERQLFLKFVTSCSNPPLLGFLTLEPAFSIRCVEVSDDNDTGDTVGSMIRGFLSIKKKENASRLPTSSTCFNLLKLPNYTKKSTLRDKLRYAISSQTGFELS